MYVAYEGRAAALSRERTGHLAGYFADHWEVFGLGQYLVYAAGTAIGICGVKWAGTSPGFWQLENRELDLGYSYVPAAWGRGYATEAARAALDVAFACAGADHVRATCDDDNLASANVLVKLGMREVTEPGAGRDAASLPSGMRRFRIERP